MDKLRKIAELFWHNKERLVFVALVGVLCWRVYEVMNPQALVDPPSHTAPRRPTEEDVPAPPVPKFRETPASDDTFASIHKRNPFWYYSGQAKTDTAPKNDQQASITLVRIMGDRARLEMNGKRKLCAKGDTFGDYEIRSIDSAAKTCEVYSGQSGRTETLNVKGR